MDDKNRDYIGIARGKEQENGALLRETIDRIKPTDADYRARAKHRQDHLVKPPGALGQLEEISIRLAGIYGQELYQTQPKAILAFAGDHGIHAEGISGQPQEVTRLAFANFPKGICSVGVLSRYTGNKVIAVDVGIASELPVDGVIDRKVNLGTKNLSKEPAMERAEALAAIAAGIETANEAIDGGYRVLGLGEMGICNTSPSSAIVACLSGKSAEEVTGIGAGSAPEMIQKKIELIEEALTRHQPDATDALDILSKVGGFEIGAMTGAILAAAARRIPVVLDGFISYAGALLAQLLAPISTEYLFASHCSAEPASILALELLGLSPALSMQMRLGEGSGATLFFHILECANEVYTNVASFEGAAVPETGLERKDHGL